MDRIEGESFGLWGPNLANELVTREAFASLQASAEVVDRYEVGEMLADYDALFDPIRQARQAKSGKQLGDPDRLAAAVLGLVESDNRPP